MQRFGDKVGLVKVDLRLVHTLHQHIKRLPLFSGIVLLGTKTLMT